MAGLFLLFFSVVSSQEGKRWTPNYTQGVLMQNFTEAAKVMYRSGRYPNCKDIVRFSVPDNKISWDVQFDEYKPPHYTAKVILGNPLADPDDVISTKFRWNKEDDYVNRTSFLGKYRVVKGYPLNPTGRTGISGRGSLIRWGPNIEANLIATRWKRHRDKDRAINRETGLPIMQVLLMKRLGYRKWNVPRTFLHPLEKVTKSMKRLFFSRNVMNITRLIEKGYSIWEIRNITSMFFRKYTKIYMGYNCRPENTDNAWVESIVLQFLDNNGESISSLPIKAAPNKEHMLLRWIDISGRNSEKYLMSCRDFLQKTAELSGCHW